MNKEELPEKYKWKNKEGNEYRLRRFGRTSPFMAIVGAFAFVLFSIFPGIEQRASVFCGILSIYFAITGISHIAIYVRYRKTCDVIYGIYFALLAAVLLALYFLRFVMFIW